MIKSKNQLKNLMKIKQCYIMQLQKGMKTKRNMDEQIWELAK